MSLLTFESYPLWLNAVIFLLAAATIWFAGVRLERYADAISTRTGLGQAFTGLLLLSIATSLPEVATTVTAVALLNNPTLAVYNLLGSVALQTAILALADRVDRQSGALTHFSPRFALLIQGVGLLLVLQLTIAGATAEGLPIIVSVSVWPVVIFLAYLNTLYLTYRYRGQPRWTPSGVDDMPVEDRARSAPNSQPQSSSEADPVPHRPLKNLWFLFSGFSLLVLVSGWAVAQSTDLLAEQTGLGDEFLGATLLALATGLPEVSTTITASRNGRYSMAISNIFGSNAFCIALLLLAELLYRGGTVMAHAGKAAIFVSAIAAIMTSIYLWGMLERQDRTVFGMGWDSAAAAVVYLGGMTVLFFMAN
ncbi:MAG TPA: sodium:calcium antiporter [Candidatus Binatia bacterium]|nr:sodium:calcium antiporter [Candidatus Binatia bacterium]